MKEAASIGEKTKEGSFVFLCVFLYVFLYVFRYVFLDLIVLLPRVVPKMLTFRLFRIHSESLDKCYLNMKRLKNIPSADDCVMVCISVTLIFK